MDNKSVFASALLAVLVGFFILSLAIIFSIGGRTFIATLFIADVCLSLIITLIKYDKEEERKNA